MVFEAIILGIIQGLTEFIPVSSSGHLLLASELFGFESDFTFEVFLNVGTLLAAITYFRKDIATILKELVRKNSNLLFINLVITTVPAVLFGLVVGHFFEDGIRSLSLSLLMLTAVGVLMIYEKELIPRASKSNLQRVKRGEALKIGLAQALALLPGTSRSAVTILMGEKLGYSPATAARYSFLASIPVITGAVLYEVFSNASALTETPASALFLGVLASFVSSILAIHFLLSFLKKHGLRVFGVYRIILAAVIVLSFIL